MSSDEILTERLKKENYEQFVTLVRMHLSFVVDINSDDVDTSTEKPKHFKWGFHRKGKSLNNAPSTDNNVITEEVLTKLYEIIDFLSKEENVSQEGIFRRTGSVSRQQELKALLLGTEPLQLDEGRFSVHDCASVLKGFLAELPEPLLMEHHYPYYCALARECVEGDEKRLERVLRGLQLVLQLVGEERRALLGRLLRLLGAVAAREASTRMAPAALATMLAPHLLCPRKSGLALHLDATLLAPLVSVMVSLGARVLRVPAPLATDVRAYLARHQHHHLDESYTDRTAARTVHTFVDAQLSRAAAARGTEHALAQLYAHIHSLPDSAHKRRLVKHFNRHNGHGTPIQVQRSGRGLGQLLSRALPSLPSLRTPKKGTPHHTPQKRTPMPKGKLDFDKSVDKLVDKSVDKRRPVLTSDESVEESCDSDDSTRSEGVLDRSRKPSPKFVSEPNLSLNDDTPKGLKERRLFRSKGPCRLNKKYSKKNGHVKTTPTSCVACFDDVGSASDSDVSVGRQFVGGLRGALTAGHSNLAVTPAQYATSTPGPGVARGAGVGAGACTPPMRRASMSPITKSTQKLPKAMQESIMTPRSRKPLIITCEQRDGSAGAGAGAGCAAAPPRAPAPAPGAPVCAPHTNDSDFVSSDDSRHDTSARHDSDNDPLTKNTSHNVSKNHSGNHSKSNHFDAVERRANENLRSDRSKSKSSDVTSRSDTSNFCQSRAASCSLEDGPKFKTSYEMSPLYLRQCRSQSLTDPFKEYLLSRSVLTAAPVDLSVIHSEQITDSLMFCLDGNLPPDLTTSEANLVFDKTLNDDDFSDSNDDTLNMSNDDLDASRFSIDDDKRRHSEASDGKDASKDDVTDDTFVSSTSYGDIAHETSLHDSRIIAGEQYGEGDNCSLSNLSVHKKCNVMTKDDESCSRKTHVKSRSPLSNLKQSFNILERLSPNRKRVSSMSEGLEIDNKKLLLSQKENFLAEVRRDLRETDL